MVHETSLLERLYIGVKAIVWFILTGLLLFSLPIVSAATNWLFVSGIILGCLLAIPTYYLLRHFSKKQGHFIYLRLATALSMMAIVFTAAPVIYFAFVTEADPLVLPQVTLSNGEKQVIYQGMVHVGSESFYKSVVYDLENALSNGYDLFYEGIQSADTEANQWFKDAISDGDELSDEYLALADVCGVKFQLNYFTLLAKQQMNNPQRHITADVTTRQLLDEWMRLTSEDPSLKKRLVDAKSSTSSSQMARWLLNQNENRKRIGGVLCRALLTLSLARPDRDTPLEPVIVDFRNQNLAHLIQQHDGNKIYVTYGAAHLPGLIRELEKQNPSWKVQSVKWLRALAAEHHYSGDESLFIPSEIDGSP